MYDVDPVDLLARELLRERAATLIAEACAWTVGLSDRPHLVRRHGRVVGSGASLGSRAAADLPLGVEEDARLELGEARPGTFADALNALTPDGRVYAAVLEDEVLTPYVLDVCVRAAERARAAHPAAWEELLDELGEDGGDLVEVVRAAEWQAPLMTEAEQLLLAALADVPLVETEAEGLPLSLVRAAEAELRAAAPPASASGVPEDDLAGALFLADVALRAAGLPVPVPPTAADGLLTALIAEGLEPEEVLVLLPHLPVQQDTADAIARRLRDTG